MPETLVEKILSHKAGRPVQAGDTVQLPVDLMWGCDMTVDWGILALEKAGFLSGEYDQPFHQTASRVKIVYDHFIFPTPNNIQKVQEHIEKYANKFGWEIYRPGHNGGIQHRVFEERGLILPWDIGLGADSHSCSPGAIGAMMTGIGSTDLAVAMLSGEQFFRVPETIRVNLHGKFQEGVSSKDLVLYLAGIFGESGANYKILEYGGEGVKNIPAYQRFTVSNMSVEMGAKTGLWPVDQSTIEYLRETKKEFPDRSRFNEKDVDWYLFLQPDAAAKYLFEVDIDLNKIAPMVALPHSPSHGLNIFQIEYALKHFSEMPDSVTRKLKRVKETAPASGGWPIRIKGGYVGSCTSTRKQDIARTAEILMEAHIPPGVTAILNPASEADLEAVKQNGLLQKFHDRGFVTIGSKCGHCFGGSDTWTEPGNYVQATNRNFAGRSGSSKVLVYLASTEITTRSLQQGFLSSHIPRNVFYQNDEEVKKSILADETKHQEIQEKVKQTQYHAGIEPIDPGKDLTHSLSEFTVWKFGDDINTDLMMNHEACKLTDRNEYMKYLLLDAKNIEFTHHYQETNYDLSRDIVVGGENFGCGSSRENAPESVMLSKTKAIIAGSFARIFYRNSMNLGLTLLEIGNATQNIDQGDRLKIDFKNYIIYNITKGQKYQAKKLTGVTRDILASGGAMNYAKERINRQ